MTIFRHECRQGKRTFWIWTLSIAFFVVICVLMFPEMKDEMDGVSEMFSSMGSFTQAFGMDRINFGTLIGFYAIECGNILGLGGAFYAALTAISALAKEESDHTSEFLLSHPVSRAKVITEKLLAVLAQILFLNCIIWVLSVASIGLIGETIPMKEITLLHLAYLLLQLEIAGICFGLSAFLNRGGVGIGLGIATLLYFLNLLKNISSSTEFLKYITPFGYAEGADIIVNGTLDRTLVLLGICYAIVGIAAAYYKYMKKDLRA